MNRMDITNESLPPILILGIDTPIGLTLIRELGEHRIPVYGIAHSADSIGLASRYLTKGFIHIGNDDELIRIINEISERHDVRFLMTISEQRILFLQKNLHRLRNITPLIPNVSAMQAVLNKDEICELAQKLGIATPINYSIPQNSIPKNVRFPVILKWANPNNIIHLLNKHKIPLLKCEYCYSEEELIHALARYKPIGKQPLIQSYCPGYGLGQMIYLHQGEPILCFQHKRIHEWPPEGGFSTLCESVNLAEHKELLHRSIELLRAINWNGPAMVEYRFNPKTTEAVLMEINGRFWGSLPLAYHAGANFGWTHYAIHVLKQKPEKINPQTNIQCMFLIPELKRLWQLFKHPNKTQDRSFELNIGKDILTLIRHFLSGGHYYVFTWNDPKPFFQDALRIIKSF